MCKLGVLISGNGTNLQAIINRCEAGDFPASVAVVISNQPDANGLKIAEELGIPNFPVSRHEYTSDKEFNIVIKQILQSFDVELVILAGYIYRLSQEVLECYPNKVINVHPSLLPCFKGAFAIREALEYGVKLTGVTVHFVTETIDGGPIILQRAVKVIYGDTEESLAKRIHAIEHVLLPQAIELYCNEQLEVYGNKVLVLD